MDVTSAPIRAEQNGLNVVKNLALKFMFVGFKLLLAEDSVRSRVSLKSQKPMKIKHFFEG